MTPDLNGNDNCVSCVCYYIEDILEKMSEETFDLPEIQECFGLSWLQNDSFNF